MADYEGYSPGQLLADASVADFIGSLGLGIAAAQRQLDENSLGLVEEYTRPRAGLNNRSLLQMGLIPAFYHYQYADLACEMDIRIRIQKSTNIGGSAAFKYGDSSSATDNLNQSNVEGQSETYDESKFRDARVSWKVATASALNINGKSYTATGNSAQEKIDNLLSQVTGDSEMGINALLYQLENPTEFNITTDADTDKVITGKRTITFVGGEYSLGIIRISENTDTTYVLNASDNKQVAATAKDTLALYANHVLDGIRDQGYSAELVDKDAAAPVSKVYFDTGKHTIRSASEQNKLRELAGFLKASGKSIMVEGFADRQMHRGEKLSESKNLNIVLGNNRANEVKNVLVALGVDKTKIQVKPSGGQVAADLASTTSSPLDQQEYRRVSITVTGRNSYWILVRANAGGHNLEGVAPPVQTGEDVLTGTSNRFIYLRGASTLNLTGKKVTVDGRDYPLRADAAAPHAEHAAESYAKNLADDVNAASGINYSGSANQNVVTLIADEDEFNLILATSTDKTLAIRETDGLRITKQFTRSTSETNVETSNASNKIAVGATFDARYKRQFEMEAYGNSRISARLVAIPAPPAFLNMVSAYLATVGTGAFSDVDSGPNPFPILTPMDDLPDGSNVTLEDLEDGE